MRSLPIVVASLLALLPVEASAQDEPTLELGDAPEGAIAYPSLGVNGLFPTCLGGPAGDIRHGFNVNIRFGNSVDAEFDGNADNCPPPPYEMDECWGAADGDGGLSVPDPFTIFQNQVTPCGQTPPRPLGMVCAQVDLSGPNSPITMNIVNNNNQPAIINVLADWNQDGRWGGQVQCPSGPVDEHWIQNILVPPGYVGPLEGLSPGQKVLGPNAGYVWFRFTISPEFPAIPIGWDGTGFFDFGETEDYLLQLVDEERGEYGDAPEEAPAYPDNGVFGAFPTCRTAGTPDYVMHMPFRRCWFGPDLDFEIEGNANNCPQPPYDQDECSLGDGDAGLLIPDPWTIVSNNYRRCQADDDRDRWSVCGRAQWGQHVDLRVVNTTPDTRYVHFLADWDRNGEWGGTSTCPSGDVVDEQVMLNFPVPGNFSGPLSALSPPDFVMGGNPDARLPVWCRFTISAGQVADDWTGGGIFDEGETEDYLIMVDPQPTDAPPHSPHQRLGELRAAPNPFNPTTVISLELREAGPLTVELFDERGRSVRVLQAGEREAGEHSWQWDGRDEAGRRVASGVYRAVASSGEEERVLAVVLLK